MNSGPNPASPILVSAFRSALLQQWLIVTLIFLLLLVAWAAARAATTGSPAAALRGGPGAAGQTRREPRGRRVLRVGFGVLWLFDGLLQAQPQMAGGLADQVIRPSAATSPGWVRHLVDWGVTVWDYHPVSAAAAAVWIQVGIGLWLIVAVHGRSVRIAGLAGVGWGLLVWVFGEAFGGIFAPGLSVLFGAPGAALIYAAAGALIALPERAWDGPRLGRSLLAGTGVFFLGMALLQAWPGRGFWQGTLHGKPGSLAAMIQDMAGTSQPHQVEAVVSGFASFTAAHGFAVNLVVVIALAVAGAGLCAATFLANRRAPAASRLALLAAGAAAVFCLADWLLVEDLGFFGGLGTDPNSMVPLIVLLAAGYLAMTQDAWAPAPAEAVTPEETVTPGEAGPAGVARGPGLLRGFAGLPPGVVAGAGALGVILVGAAPMAVASLSAAADPVIAQALAGSSASFDTQAPDFTLTSQDGRQVSLASLRGKVVLLTFLDPVCTTDCPLIAQEMRAADALLGGKAASTELVAVVANPTYISTAYTKAFTAQENLGGVPNWLFLTGSLSQLASVWQHYGIEVQNLPAGAMAAHNDLAFVIGADGHMRQEISDDPGPGTSATTSSFAGLMASSVLRTMGQR